VSYDFTHPPKDPDDVLDYSRPWGKWLATGETITTSSWIVPTGITKGSDTYDDTSATIWLSGGVAGGDYLITNRITTSAGRTVDRTFRIQVRER